MRICDYPRLVMRLKDLPRWSTGGEEITAFSSLAGSLKNKGVSDDRGQIEILM
jgi:hypothetical protein